MINQDAFNANIPCFKRLKETRSREQKEFKELP